MFEFKIIRNPKGGIERIETSLTGYDLLDSAKLNKGCAFTCEEREQFKLTGLLPNQTETLDQQVKRMYEQYSEHKSSLGKNIYLNVLHDYNETLFYKLVNQHIEEMLPIIYTPTVGEAVERFSLELRKPHGLYISYPQVDKIADILNYRLPPEIDLIVVTDGEAILGIGDQGIGGINISSAKLMVYTLAGMINPHRVLPIQLDVGTNNQVLLNEPMYIGWRHERITGQAYDDFIAAFVAAVTKKFPNVLLHWEDFGRDNARRILNQYRDKILTFNGDIQGTAVVTASCVVAGAKASGTPLKDHRIVIFGAGTAGVGIADQLVEVVRREGLSEAEARARFWLIDKSGLLTDSSPNILPFQKPFVRKSGEVTSWKLNNPATIDLLDVVRNIQPTILIGCSAVGGAFSQEILQTMAKQTARPIILPLSNPTQKAEATPEDILKWTNAKAIIATGSPFPNVNFEGRQIRIAQSNNAFAFPGIGLGAIAVKAKRLSDDMIWAAIQALSMQSPVHQDATAPLLPRISEMSTISKHIAKAVGEQARKEGLAQIDSQVTVDQAIENIIWEPKYYPYKKV